MAYRQTYMPNVNIKAARGWCLKFVDDAGDVKNTAPPRTPNARAALNVESKAGRLKTGALPVGIWVVGFLDLKAGPYAADDHVFLMKYLGSGKYEIHDSETNAGARAVYPNIDAVVAWFGAYSPVFAGWSTHCDGRQYAEAYTPAAATKSAVRKAAKGTATVTVDTLNVRNSASTKASIVAQYHKGQKFNYDSYVVANGYVWLSYVSFGGTRRYVAEGPDDGNNNTVYLNGGV